MTKRQLIDEIVSMNLSAKPGFLARFADGDLNAYLRHLRVAHRPRLAGDPHRYDHYFADCPAIRLSQTAQSAEVAEAPAAVASHDDSTPDDDLAGRPMDLNVSTAAYFKPSYEAKAS